MKYKFLLSSVAVLAVFGLTACSMGGMTGGGSMNGMGHGTMSSGTMRNTMPMSGTMPMSTTMSMSNTLPMGQNNMAGMMGMTDQMMTQVQGMMDGSMKMDQSHIQTMNEQMNAMQGMMKEMHEMMSSGSMPMEQTHRQEMNDLMGKMNGMLGMMNQLHDKMTDGSLSMDKAQMEAMTAHMAQMGSMMQMMQSMMDGSMTMSDTMSGTMSMSSSNQPFDLLFIDSMIVHHQGAVTMASEAQQAATKAEIKTLAAAIIVAQEAEIKQMQAWRQAWYPAAAATAGMGMDMGTMAVAAGDKLYDLRFIEAMIPHHEGAIGMAKEALTKAEHPELKSLAENIIKAQEGEIARMKEWFKAWNV